MHRRDPENIEMKRCKENKAVVASNVMHVVGQHPRFLRAHWKFCKTVVFNLFEFMHETFPGVQDMAVGTFLNISQTCKRRFVTAQMHEQHPLAEEMMGHLHGSVTRPQTQHLCTAFAHTKLSQWHFGPVESMPTR